VPLNTTQSGSDWEDKRSAVAALVSAPTAVRQSMPAEWLSAKKLENPSWHKHLICSSSWTEPGLTTLYTTWNGYACWAMADGFAKAKKASSLSLQHSPGSMVSK